MNRVVAAVAAVDLMSEWHGAVANDVQAEDELLEIRPVVLIVAVRDPRLFHRRLVGTVERHARRVLMDPAGVEFELLDDVQREQEEEASRAGRDQCVEGASGAVVVDRSLLYCRQAERGRIDRGQAIWV